MEKLTNQQKQELRKAVKQTRDVCERLRLCVILGYDNGDSIDQLASTLQISRRTVYSYLEQFHKSGKTKNDPQGGSEPKLNKEQEKELVEHLSTTTYLKAKDICAYIEKTYGISYKTDGMRQWLKIRGFVFKKPKKIPGKLDPQQQETFITEYNDLKENLNPGDVICFMDAVHPEYQSQAGYGWMKRNEQKTLQSTGKQVRLHLAGAICLTTMQLWTEEYETVDRDATIDFLKKLESSLEGGTIHLMLDNARANKNKKMNEFLKTSRIKVHYLPPYSPNLNPIERVWKLMRESKIYNRYYESAAVFFKEIKSFFTEEIPRMTDVLAKRINDNFQVININPIRLAVQV